MVVSNTVDSLRKLVEKQAAVEAAAREAAAKLEVEATTEETEQEE